MLRTNTDATVYNRRENKKTGKITFHRHYLPAVFWEPRQGANIRESGLSGADLVSVYIPYDDTFVEPAKYRKSSPVKTWTLAQGEDYIFKGNVDRETVSEDEMTKLRKTTESYKITTVDAKLYGSWRLWHWEVGGK